MLNVGILTWAGSAIEIELRELEKGKGRKT